MYFLTLILVALSTRTPISQASPTKLSTTKLFSRQAGSSGDTPIQVNHIVDGYVAFGDSFSAGIGTGQTEGSGCRRGEYSYPKQLLAATTPGAEFQNLACSGATRQNILEGGPDSQIDAWNPTKSDVGTISIGGNDVGFYNILTACILRVGLALAGDCDTAIQRSRDIMSTFDFATDIKQVLTQIIGKATRPNFKLYQVGYPMFFNEDTASCDDATFKIWNPHRKSTRIENDGPYLTRDLRRRVNELTRTVNAFLAERAEQANREVTLNSDGTLGARRIFFIDPNSVFDGHRFCDVDSSGVEVLEPAPSNLNSWFFLSNWGDNGPAAAVSAAQELEALKQTIPGLPSSETCQNVGSDWAGEALHHSPSNLRLILSQTVLHAISVLL